MDLVKETITAICTHTSVKDILNWKALVKDNHYSRIVPNLEQIKELHVSGHLELRRGLS